MPPRSPRSEPCDAPAADSPPRAVTAPVEPPGRESSLPRLPCVKALGPPQGAPQVRVVLQNLGACATPVPQPLTPFLYGFLATFLATFLTPILRAFATALLKAFGSVSRIILTALLALLLSAPFLATLLRTALTKLLLPLPDAPLLPLLPLAALLDRPLPALTGTLLRPRALRRCRTPLLDGAPLPGTPALLRGAVPLYRATLDGAALRRCALRGRSAGRRSALRCPRRPLLNRARRRTGRGARGRSTLGLSPLALRVGIGRHGHGRQCDRACENSGFRRKAGL